MTSVCINVSDWRDSKDRFLDLRKYLAKEYGFPIQFEMHAHQFLLDKNPYRDLGLSIDTRKEIISYYFKLINTLPVFITNVCIDKRNIRFADFNVLEQAFGYNLVRVHNTLKNPKLKFGSDPSFMVITDEGRVGKMRKIARKLQHDNNIPSKRGTGTVNVPLDSMIEDVLDKNSRESHFIQVADLVGYFIGLFIKRCLPNPIQWNKRLLRVLDHGEEEQFLNMCSNALNLMASRSKYGIVYYPRP